LVYLPKFNFICCDKALCLLRTMYFPLSNFYLYKVLYFVDLSFNNIEMIEGLDKLTCLQDLTLYNNRISRIENMDKLTDLHVFSIGNNNLTDLDNVSDIYILYFKKCLK